MFNEKTHPWLTPRVRTPISVVPPHAPFEPATDTTKLATITLLSCHWRHVGSNPGRLCGSPVRHQSEPPDA